MNRSTSASAAPEPAPELVTAQHAAMLLASLVLADGSIDPDEIALARKACDEFSIPLDYFDAALGAVSSDPVQSFAATLLKVEHPADRERLASILFEIASVDEKLDHREVRLLEAMRQSWGVSVAFLNKPIEWDADQLAVIKAKRSEKRLISAGPGMGKTAVACSRVAHLVEQQDVADSNIWLVSFTRSAIAELKGRIGDFAEDPSNVFAVKISTIDSQAWKIRYGFSEEEVEKLFGGFETGIDAALKLIDDRIEDFRDIFGDLEHLIIDEAQDITGGRARFLLKMIELLPMGCGVTVFHDPAQAIYDYAAKGEELFRFTDGLQEMLGDKLALGSLKKIYRTEEAPLLKLYEDLRLDILGNADVPPENFKSKTDLVKAAATSVEAERFDGKSLKGYDDALVLFRRRIEVAQASAFMASDGHAHRLRMSGMGRMPLPWLALTLGETAGRLLSKSEFADRAAVARDAYPALLYGEDVESNSAAARWERLRRYASGAGGDIDLYKLRARLAGSPPDEFIAPEFGHRGPILGTIHASKGREADHVFLQINDNWGLRSGPEQQDFAEEARVLFVGATRAKRSLAVQGGFELKFATQTESGRSYRKTRKNGYQFQIGLQGDFDLFSPARLKDALTGLAATPLPASCTARLETGTWIWHVTTDTGVKVGSLTRRVTNDMYEISKKYHGSGRRLHDVIRHIALMGFGTMVAAHGDERLAGARGHAAASGFWLVPQISGLSMVYV